MKPFRQYLMESVRTYHYKIKIAGNPDKNWLDMFMMNLQKFDPVKISAPKSTPIQKEPYGFPGLENQSVTIIDAEFKYPAVEPMVKQLARLLNYDENLVRMIQADYDDSINQETEKYANQASHTPVLTHEELEDNGKEAAKEYGEQYLPRIMKDAEKDKIDMPYAAPKTKPAVDMRKMPGNDKSPMTTINRPPRPETGASAARK
jgi:hypothetical protein